MPAFAQAPPLVKGTSYYIDSVDGNDFSSGLSPASAWKTAAKINSVNLNPGDGVFFRCGGTYECALTLTLKGTADMPIIISAYGSGNRPVLTTGENTEVLRLFDCSYLYLSDLEITAHNGGGIWIDTLNETSTGISIERVFFHDIQNYKVNSRDNLSAGAAAARACIMIKGLPARSRFAVNDLKISHCNMYDCGNGISIWGSWNDEQNPWCENEEDIDPVYNKGVLVEYCNFSDMDAEAVIVGMCDGAVVTHCSAINCCQGEGVDENGKVLFYNAAMWFWGSENSVIEYCEISGQKNVGDGMAVDFDSHSNNCTYQYIYSHDNTRFMCNCPIFSGQHGNTVRYCLSVNDNRGRSKAASSSGEYNFSFYNNTIVNCGNFFFTFIHDSVIKNNIIIPSEGCSVDFGNAFSWLKNEIGNNCYYNCLTPPADFGSINADPGFAGGDCYDISSYKLVTASPCLGSGAPIEENDCSEDFFQQAISSIPNIGCYGGEGVEGEYKDDSLWQKIVEWFTNVFYLIRNFIISV
jgi:hypothetical protein